MPVGQDVMISVYNIHHSPAVWDDPEAFKPERFPLDEPVPNEANTDYRHAALLPLAMRCLPDSDCGTGPVQREQHLGHTLLRLGCVRY